MKLFHREEHASLQPESCDGSDHLEPTNINNHFPGMGKSTKSLQIKSAMPTAHIET